MTGKIYYFDPKDLEIRRGTHVIVETTRGMEYGTVILGPKNVPDEEVVQPLREVIRIATPDDDEREWENRYHEREAYQICKEKIQEHELDMKLIQAEYTFDNNKLLFYFTAEGRIDFRDLVKDLAGIFRTRIELRQIGVRDETKILGGIGICGRELCCHTFLSDFAPVSIKMAKEQNLSLNPTKISGTCGRLMCCLNNEADTYHYLNSKLPKNNEIVRTADGFTGKVQSVSVLRQHVKVIIEKGDEREVREYPVEELGFRGHEPEAHKEEKLVRPHIADDLYLEDDWTEEVTDGAAEERRRSEKKDRSEKKNGEGREKKERRERSGQNGQNEGRGGKGKNRGQKDASAREEVTEELQDQKNSAQQQEPAAEQPEKTGRRRRRHRSKGGSGEGWDQARIFDGEAEGGARAENKGRDAAAAEQGSGSGRQEKASDGSRKDGGKNGNAGKNGQRSGSQRRQNPSGQQKSQSDAAGRRGEGSEDQPGSGSPQKRRRRRNRGQRQNRPKDGGES